MTDYVQQVIEEIGSADLADPRDIRARVVEAAREFLPASIGGQDHLRVRALAVLARDAIWRALVSAWEAGGDPIPAEDEERLADEALDLLEAAWPELGRIVVLVEDIHQARELLRRLPEDIHDPLDRERVARRRAELLARIERDREQLPALERAVREEIGPGPVGDVPTWWEGLDLSSYLRGPEDPGPNGGLGWPSDPIWDEETRRHNRRRVEDALRKASGAAQERAILEIARLLGVRLEDSLSLS